MPQHAFCVFTCHLTFVLFGKKHMAHGCLLSRWKLRDWHHDQPIRAQWTTCMSSSLFWCCDKMPWQTQLTGERVSSGLPFQRGRHGRQSRRAAWQRTAVQKQKKRQGCHLKAHAQWCTFCCKAHLRKRPRQSHGWRITVQTHKPGEKHFPFKPYSTDLWWRKSMYYYELTEFEMFAM